MNKLQTLLAEIQDELLADGAVTAWAKQSRRMNEAIASCGEAFTVCEIVMKLVGPIMPIGEASPDNERIKNLAVLLELITNLLKEVRLVVPCSNSGEYSIKRAGHTAREFLSDLNSDFKT